MVATPNNIKTARERTKEKPPGKPGQRVFEYENYKRAGSNLQF
jgi:hypothetical protein